MWQCWCKHYRAFVKKFQKIFKKMMIIQLIKTSFEYYDKKFKIESNVRGLHCMNSYNFRISFLKNWFWSNILKMNQICIGFIIKILINLFLWNTYWFIFNDTIGLCQRTQYPYICFIHQRWIIPTWTCFQKLCYIMNIMLDFSWFNS